MVPQLPGDIAEKNAGNNWKASVWLQTTFRVICAIGLKTTHRLEIHEDWPMNSIPLRFSHPGAILATKQPFLCLSVKQHQLSQIWTGHGHPNLIYSPWAQKKIPTNSPPRGDLVARAPLEWVSSSRISASIAWSLHLHLSGWDMAVFERSQLLGWEKPFEILQELDFLERRRLLINDLTQQFQNSQFVLIES